MHASTFKRMNQAIKYIYKIYDEEEGAGQAGVTDNLRKRGRLNVILLCNGVSPCKANSVSEFSSLRMMTQRVLYQASRYINTQTHAQQHTHTSKLPGYCKSAMKIQLIVVAKAATLVRFMCFSSKRQ